MKAAARTNEVKPEVVNRLMSGTPNTNATEAEIEYALAALRSDNVRTHEFAKGNADARARDQEAHRRECDNLRKEIFKLHDELFGAREKIYELQKQLLALRTTENVS